MPSMNPALVNSIRQMKSLKGLQAEPNKQDSSKSNLSKAHRIKKVKFCKKYITIAEIHPNQ